MFPSFVRGALVPSLSRRLLATVTTDLARVTTVRHDWSRQEIQKIYDGPLLDLVFRAAAVHRQYHHPGKIQLCTLMNIKSTATSALFPWPFVLISVVQREGAPRTVSDNLVFDWIPA